MLKHRSLTKENPNPKFNHGDKIEAIQERGFFVWFVVFLKHDQSIFPCSSPIKSGIGETVHKNSSETPTNHEKFHPELSKPDSYK